MRSRRRHRHHPDKSFWTSYSDVIAGLLLVIILVFVASASIFQREAKAMREQNESLQAQSARFKQETEELKGYAARGVCIRDSVLAILDTQLKLILRQEGVSGDAVQRREDGLVLLFDDVVRFDTGSADLNSIEARQRALKRILDARDAFYATPQADDIVDKIHIVGRTDLTGNDLLNMLLSIKRSGAVLGLLSWKCEGEECGPIEYRYSDADSERRFTSKLTVQGIGRQGARTRFTTATSGEQIAVRDNPEFRRVELHFVAKSPLIINADYRNSNGRLQVPAECRNLSEKRGS